MAPTTRTTSSALAAVSLSKVAFSPLLTTCSRMTPQFLEMRSARRAKDAPRGAHQRRVAASDDEDDVDGPDDVDDEDPDGEEDDEEDDNLTEEERMEEGRKMFPDLRRSHV